MCRTNGLKKIYESELNRKSKYYAVFDALLRHFRYAEAAVCQEVGAVGSQEMGKLIFGDEKLNRQYSADMIPFLRSGELVEQIVEDTPVCDSYTLQDVFACDKQARAYVQERV